MSVIILDNSSILSNLRKIVVEENIKIDEPMSKHTSFKTGGLADFYIIAKSEEEIKTLLEKLEGDKNDVELFTM